MPARAFRQTETWVIGRAACDRRTIHVHDLAAEDISEYPVAADCKTRGPSYHACDARCCARHPHGVISNPTGRSARSRQTDRPSQTFADQARDRKRAPVRSRKAAHAGAYARQPRSRRTRSEDWRLVDANIIGIFIWDVDGRIIEADKLFLRLVQYNHRRSSSPSRCARSALTREEMLLQTGYAAGSRSVRSRSTAAASSSPRLPRACAISHSARLRSAHR